jgi:hypothetical protein
VLAFSSLTLARRGVPMAFIENRGAKIYWDEQGQGEPVLLIMGLGWASAM